MARCPTISSVPAKRGLSAFDFFGGINQIVVPDCLKSAVTKPHPWVAKINAAYLKALPASLYEYIDILDARVHIDYHIEYERQYYSVTHNLTKTTVEVHASAKLVSVFARGQRVACHAKSQVRAGYTTFTEHMPGGHKFMAERSAERFESKDWHA